MDALLWGRRPPPPALRPQEALTPVVLPQSALAPTSEARSNPTENTAATRPPPPPPESPNVARGRERHAPRRRRRKTIFNAHTLAAGPPGRTSKRRRDSRFNLSGKRRDADDGRLASARNTGLDPWLGDGGDERRGGHLWLASDAAKGRRPNPKTRPSRAAPRQHPGLRALGPPPPLSLLNPSRTPFVGDPTSEKRKHVGHERGKTAPRQSKDGARGPADLRHKRRTRPFRSLSHDPETQGTEVGGSCGRSHGPDGPPKTFGDQGPQTLDISVQDKRSL